MNSSPAAQPQALGERITVTLIPKAGDDLRQLQERTNLSKTDLANRAITLYEFLDAQLRAGRDLIIRDSRTGETYLVRLVDAPAGQATSTRSAWYRRSAAGSEGQPGRQQSRRLATARSGRLPGTGRRLVGFGLTVPEMRSR
ncbi:MAG TPA: hypothetical protein VGI74_22485 [Streptosporangiaceae bacterium]|jgi:hypothetical protein